MKGPGLFSMIQIVAGMSMAAPMFVLGFDMVLGGAVLTGLALFGLGGIAMFAPTYVIRRIGGPRAWIKNWLGLGARSDSHEDDEFQPFSDQ